MNREIGSKDWLRRQNKRRKDTRGPRRENLQNVMRFSAFKIRLFGISPRNFDRICHNFLGIKSPGKDRPRSSYSRRSKSILTTGPCVITIHLSSLINIWAVPTVLIEQIGQRGQNVWNVACTRHIPIKTLIDLIRCLNENCAVDTSFNWTNMPRRVPVSVPRLRAD